MLNLILLPLVLGLVQYRVVAQQLAACTLTGYDWVANTSFIFGNRMRR